MNSNTHTPKFSNGVINQIKEFFKPKNYKKHDKKHDSKLSQNVINQIKDFPFYNALTEEQKSLVDELIPNELLRERYKKHGLCDECSQPNTGRNWCQSCNSKHFQQEFNKWTSGDGCIWSRN